MDENPADKTIARLIQAEHGCDETTESLRAALSRQYRKVLQVRQNLQDHVEKMPGDQEAGARYQEATATLGRIAVALGNLSELRLKDHDNAV